MAKATAAKLARELAYPLTDGAVLMSWLALFLVVRFAVSGGVLGLLLLLLVLPSLFRYLMRVLDARAKGQDPGPLSVDDLLWFGSAWSLFVIVHVAVLIYVSYFVGRRYGLGAMLVVDALLAAVIPASLAVLAVTRTPAESLMPRAIAGVIERCGTAYWLLPSYLVVAAGLIPWLHAQSLPGLLVDLFSAYLVVAFFALTGAIVRPLGLHDEVMIHEPVEPDQESLDQELLQERTNVLNHAYGFISRGNRAGGFKHIRDWLGRDPEPDAAWAWYFEHMLRWEIKEPALVYAQTYLSRLLANGDYVAAVKVIMRCRLVNEAWKPLSADRDLAVEAAQNCGNEELAKSL